MKSFHIISLAIPLVLFASGDWAAQQTFLSTRMGVTELDHDISTSLSDAGYFR
jgi:hypothetical protein